MVRHHPSPCGAAVIVVLAVLLLLAGGQRPAYTDDIDLLRFTTAKPYVYFIIDNSASMALSSAGEWVHANGDDPRSKLYQVKRVVYDVFKDVNDIQFGFAAFNQDNARATAKHWLYYVVSSTSNKLPNGWPINYPAPDNDGPIVTAANGTVTSDIEGDLMTFGPHLGGADTAGTCLLPLTFGNVGTDDREKLNRFAKLNLGGSTTTLWIKGGAGNKTYRLTVDRPNSKPDTSPNPELGKDDMDVRLTLDEIKNNGCVGPQIQSSWSGNVTLTLWTDFLMFDENNGRTAPNGSKAGGVDFAAGFWEAKDVLADTTCGSGHPFSGKGWEGNYDTTLGEPNDPFCSGGPATCYNLKRPTIVDPDYSPPLDKGDMLPFDWRTEQKAEFLQRFAPNYPSGSPDFRIASYFADRVDATTGVLPLNNASQIPLFAAGPTPLGKSVIDFRCWYLGEGNKCNDDAYGAGGWETLAASKDSEWGCRRPYLIVLSDGGDSCAGENPCADTANLNSKGGVQTWVIAYGADCTKAGNPLKCMAQNGKGELLCPATATDLKTELEKILGLIRQESRAFASAAVPSVQAIVDDKIFLTNFTPLNGKSVWDGHVNAFIKPLPIDPLTSKPDTSDPNHLWDAGEVMLDQQVNAADPTGPEPGKRRVFYPLQNDTNAVPATPRLFERTVTGDPNAIRYDLWRGLGLGFIEGDTTSETNAQNAANAVIANTFAVKTAIVDVRNPDGTTTPTTVRYVLGDVFHSNPLVVGGPPNVRYFSLDLNGYRSFANKHRLRRKMLLVGANDGMLHAFDAGMYDQRNPPSDSSNLIAGNFTRGSGREIFAFMPRAVMPTVRLLGEATTTNHQWSVDGTVTVSDVFIDPLHNGTPTSGEREWRTVVVGGLREGGSSYYALDITQPDKLTTGNGPFPLEDFVPRAAPSEAITDYVPWCLQEGNFDVSSCGPVPFPAVLWEFNDSVVTPSGTREFLDEDANDKPDMGETWSISNVGRIRVAVAAGSETTRDVYVAVFGGGLDPAFKTNPQQGTWIYIVDIETGRAIYKRRLDGSVPSEPAAVDTNNDGYLDRIYVGTTKGWLYRIDVTADILNDPADPTDDVFPALETVSVLGMDGLQYDVQRIPATSWKAHKILNASFDATTGLSSPAKPIFFRPSVIYDAKLGTYLLAVGTGDRDELFVNDGTTGRFFVFLDDTDELPQNADGSLVNVLDETDFLPIGVADDPDSGTNIETLTVGQRGWALRLDANERVINDPFALSGVTFFSTFKPRVEVTESREGPQCAKTGLSRVFILSTLTANAFVQPPQGVTEPPKRFFEVPHFVTNPFSEQRQTKNQRDNDGDGIPNIDDDDDDNDGIPDDDDPDDDNDGIDDEDDPDHGSGGAEICDDPTKIAIMESLKTLFPPNCKFSNAMVDIKTIAANTSLVCIAPVPVCLIQKNWKEW
jgi:hypothetical protein